MSRHYIGSIEHRRVYVEVVLNGDKFSVCGEIGVDQFGQCSDTIRAALDSGELEPAKRWPADRIRQLLDHWDRWHLNDMRPGCEHQCAGVAVEPGDPSEGTSWSDRPIDPDKPTDTYGKHFPGQRHDSWNLLGWVREDEHAAGLLSRECPTCGYRYGTAWLKEDLPADVREFVAAL